jgi:hypothetical protein
MKICSIRFDSIVFDKIEDLIYWKEDRASASGRSAREKKVPNADFNLTKAFVTQFALEKCSQIASQFAFAG